VGQFNDVVADYAIKALAALPGKPQVWAVGERVHAHLADAGLPLMGLFAVPNSVQAITPLVGQIQIESEAHRANHEYVFMSSTIVRSPGRSTTVAGNGFLGFSGDGGPATSAALNFPAGVVVDAAGNLYIADSTNNRVRKVTPGMHAYQQPCQSLRAALRP
jgi:hypothetical protein